MKLSPSRMRAVLPVLAIAVGSLGLLACNKGDNKDDSGGSSTETDGSGSSGGTATAGGTDATGSGGATSDGGTSDGGTSTAGDTDSGSTSSGGGNDGTPASNIRLTVLEFNQGVAVPIAENGSPLEPRDRLVPGGMTPRLVAGRGGLFRAMWETEAGWSSRTIEAQLTLEHPNGERDELTDELLVDGAPDPSRIDGTFHWQLTGDQVQAGTQYSVDLFEAGPGAGPPPASPPRIPQSGTADLGVPDVTMELHITFVPVTVRGTTPNLNADNVSKITDGYFDMNPVRDIIVTVREGISASGGSIDSALDAVSQARSADNPPDDEYYIGFAPVSETGWSGIASWRSAASPLSNTVNFPQEDTIGFAVHETGHNQDMPHTPGYGAGGTTGDWPFPGDTTINIQGYGVRSGELYDKNDFEDYMNYCTPDWPSVYTWEETWDNISSMARTPLVSRPHASTQVLRGLVRDDGSGHFWVVPSETPTNAPWRSTVVDLTLTDGSAIRIPGRQQLLSDANVHAIEAELPVSLHVIDAIFVHAGRHELSVVPAGLTDRFDALVAGPPAP